MGEPRTIRTVRAVGLAVTAAAAVALLTSCAQLGGAAGAGASTPDPAPPSATAPSTASSSTAPVQTVAPAPAPAATDPAPAPLPTPSEGGRAAVVPFVTSAVATGTAVDVGAIVPSVVEDDGRCTATATSGDVTRTATGTAVGASSYTGCEAMRIADVAPGTWQVRVRYASATASGVSAARTVTVG